MTTRRAVQVCCTAAITLTALAPVPSEAAPRAPRGKKDRTIKTNGPALNGTRLDADPASPRALDYADLRAGPTLASGKKARGARFADGAIVLPGARADLAGALLDAVATDGKPVRLRIDAVAPAPDPDPQTPANEAAGLSAYTLSFQNGAKNRAGAFVPAGEFAPLCNGGPALAVPGRWDYFRGRPGDGRRTSADPSSITFSCADAAIAKCVLMGYRPWARGDHRPLDELHQACTRAVRADYCGTGDSATVAGTLINIYDSANVQRDTAEWSLEATWDARGARCVASPRLTALPDDPRISVTAFIGRTCPGVLRTTCVIERAPARPTIFTEHR